MAHDIKLIVYPVTDWQQAQAFYSKYLGIEAYVAGEYYVGFKLGDDLEIGLDPNGQDVVAYIDVDDIASYVTTLVEAGGSVRQDATEVGGGLLIAKIADADGNVIGLRQETK